LTACAAFFDNGLIDQTCEDIDACDSAISEDTSVPEDSGDSDTGDPSDTAEPEIPFVPNRYHTRFFAPIINGDITTHSNWPVRLEVHAFDQSRGSEFDPDASCVLSLFSNEWNNVVVLSGAYAGFRPVESLWSISGRCNEMDTEDLSELLDEFEQYSLMVAFAPLTPETMAALAEVAEPLPSSNMGAFYLKIVDGPDELLISPGAVFGLAVDQQGNPHPSQKLDLDNVTVAPDGFYETISLTHHALP